jgi:ribosomal protein S18 acetylase RimI-like enzyme
MLNIPMMALSDCQEKSEYSSLAWLITAADWRDYTQVNQLERTCFGREDLWPFWDLIGVLTLPGMVRLKAVLDGKLVGFIGGERETGKRLGWVTTLAVLPDYRRRGIALALLVHGEDALGMPRIRLSVRATNDAAIQLYETNGYIQVDRWEKYYVGGEDALVFEKRR